MSRKDLLAAIPGLTPGPLPTDRPPRRRPDESRDRRLTARNNELLEAGRHPATGAALLDEAWGYHCRDCTHAVRVDHHDRQWWKCGVHRLGMSHSSASDIRAGWPACTRFRLDA